MPTLTSAYRGLGHRLPVPWLREEQLCSYRSIALAQRPPTKQFPIVYTPWSNRHHPAQLLRVSQTAPSRRIRTPQITTSPERWLGRPHLLTLIFMGLSRLREI